METKSIPWNYIAGAFIGFGIIYLIVILTRGMGEGDIDIALICGLFLGIKGILVTLFLAIILYLYSTYKRGKFYGKIIKNIWKFSF